MTCLEKLKAAKLKIKRLEADNKYLRHLLSLKGKGVKTL